MTIFAAGFALGLAGCEGRTGASDYDATVDAFHGQLTHKGEPVGFPGEKRVILRLVYLEKGERFGIPINPDGSFQIGWMPIGKYAATLEREEAAKRGERGGSRPTTYSLSDGFAIEEGKTNYEVELGENWKP